MKLDDAIRQAVATIDGLTVDLQAEITLESRSGVTNAGEPTFDSGVTHRAIVEDVELFSRVGTGDEVLATSIVTFPRPTSVKAGDRITLPNGSVVFVQSVRSVVDPVSGTGYAPQAWVGRSDTTT